MSPRKCKRSPKMMKNRAKIKKFCRAFCAIISILIMPFHFKILLSKFSNVNYCVLKSIYKRKLELCPICEFCRRMKPNAEKHWILYRKNNLEIFLRRKPISNFEFLPDPKESAWTSRLTLALNQTDCFFLYADTQGPGFS